MLETVLATPVCIHDPVIETSSIESEDAVFYDTMDELCNSESEGFKAERVFIKYILKQKDTIIRELQERINLLNIHIEFLKEKAGKTENIESLKDKTKQSTEQGKKQNKFDARKTPVVSDTKKLPSAAKQNKTINTKDISLITHKMVTEQKINEILLLDDLRCADNHKFGSEVPSVSPFEVADNVTVHGTRTASQFDEDKDVKEVQKNHENDGFELVKSRRTNRDFPRNTRPNPIKGSNNCTGDLEIAQKVHWVFLSGFSRTMETENIINFLKKHNLQKDCVCEKMKTKKHKQISSFKLGVPNDLKDKVMDPDLWPVGTTINHFINLQRRQTQMKTL